MVYRLLLIGGPLDGDEHMGMFPFIWYEFSGERYEAELDEASHAVVEEGDQGHGQIEVIQVESGDCYSPPVQTIRMHYAGKARGPKGVKS